MKGRSDFPRKRKRRGGTTEFIPSASMPRMLPPSVFSGEIPMKRSTLIVALLGILITCSCTANTTQSASRSTRTKTSSYVYSVDEISLMTVGDIERAIPGLAKWKNDRYIPPLQGDYLPDFKPLPHGTPLAVYGPTIPYFQGAVPVLLTGHGLRILFLHGVRYETPLGCVLADGQYAMLEKNWKRMVSVVVHGRYALASTNVIWLQVVGATGFPALQNCVIDEMIDTHGDTI